MLTAKYLEGRRPYEEWLSLYHGSGNKQEKQIRQEVICVGSMLRYLEPVL